MARGTPARKRRSARRADGATGVSKARGAAATGTLLAASDETPDAELADAMTGECANCGHGAPQHFGADNMGPCSECECTGFKAEENALSVLALAPHDFAAVVAGLAPEHAALVRVRLENFTVGLSDGVTDLLPVEHKPGERKPRVKPGPPRAVPVQPTRAGRAEVQWSATFVPEGKLTDDGRAMAPGSITWRELPLTLMAMTETSEGGHIGAEVAGRIDLIWRDDAAGLIRASGVFDAGDYGQEIARMVDERVLTGVSVDLAIHEYEVGPRSDYFDADGNWAPKPQDERDGEPSILDLLGLGDAQDEPTVFVVTSAVIGMTTVCPFPAFADAKIEVASSLVASASETTWTVTTQGGFVAVEVSRPAEEPSLEGLTAAAAGMAPVHPPAAWFADPELDELTALTVDEDGRIFGHAWAWDTCHTAFQDACVVAPHSEHAYAYFHLGEIACDDGARVPCGKITLDTGHANARLSRADATAHYDHTGTVVADVCCGEDEFGGWVAGALRPDVDAEKARVLRAAVLSGDWRNVDGNLELVALLAVNVPGFPVPRVRALVASGDEEQRPEVLTLVAAGVHRGLPEDTADLADDVVAQLAELRDRALQRRESFEAAFARLAEQSAAAALEAQ